MNIAVKRGDSETVLFDGIGEWNGETLSYLENETRALTRIRLLNEGVHISRTAKDIKTEMVLIKGRERATVASAEGELLLQGVELLWFKRNDDIIKVKYHFEEDIVLTIRLL